jgi:outer membrane protein, heavy metal efflux system
MERVFIAVLAAALLVPAGRAQAETRSLTYEAVLALARQRAPELAAARMRVVEARGRLRGASVLLRDNPQIEALAGAGFGDQASPLVEVNLWQPFELGGRRSARMRAARAGIAREAASTDVLRRRVLRDAAVSFAQALHARAAVENAVREEALATNALAAAQRRQKSGETGVLEVNTLASVLSRARAARRRAESDVVRTLLRLRLLLDLAPEDRLVLRGSLEEVRRLESGVGQSGRSPAPAHQAGAGERPELRAARAELAEAEAEAELGRGSRWPDMALGVRYLHGNRENGVLGGLSFTLPVFERGQGQTVQASARRDRAALELGAARRAIALESAAAGDVSRSLDAAARELESAALPKAEENARLAERAYAAGEIGLSDLLSIQRESVTASRAYNDALLEAALAAIERRASRGELR